MNWTVAYYGSGIFVGMMMGMPLGRILGNGPYSLPAWGMCVGAAMVCMALYMTHLPR